MDIKQVICHKLEWNYNDIEVDICKVGEHHYYLVSIAYDISFKTMIDSFVQSGLYMKKLKISSQSNPLSILNSSQMGRRASQSDGPLG